MAWGVDVGDDLIVVSVDNQYMRIKNLEISKFSRQNLKISLLPQYLPNNLQYKFVHT